MKGELGSRSYEHVKFNVFKYNNNLSSLKPNTEKVYDTFREFIFLI